MENTTRHNLHLTGESSVAGGLYNNVRITGDEIIQGDLDCINLKLIGTCDIRGSVKAQMAKVTGTADIRGSLEAEEFTIAGTINIDQNAAVKRFKIYGETKVRGNAAVEQAEIFGQLDINGECNTETFTAKGPLRIGGLLNAGKIDLEMHSQCRIKEIGGEQINIRRGTDMIFKKIVKFFCMPRDFYQGHLITDSIEGDDIYLEYTQAKVVRGGNITLGPGCKISLVEYKHTFHKHEDSKIGDSRRV